MPDKDRIANLFPQHNDDRRKFISEAFHSFHQPLTVIHCGLELSLLKQWTEEEHRQRVGVALETAGAILKLNKAVRELVDASDPGEALDRIELKPLLASLVQDLGYVAEAEMVAMRMECPEQIFIAADPNKLACHFGNLATVLIRSADPGSSIQLKVHRDESTISFRFTIEGNRRKPEELDLQQKLDQIRLDAACSYVWALTGEFRRTKKGFAIDLPALN